MTSEYESNDTGDAGSSGATQGPTPGAETGDDGRSSYEPNAEQQRASWMEQLQTMIDGIARQSGPALRELAAKAAELAAKAGEGAGPVAHRAADVTGDVGQKVAARGRELANELRRTNSSGGGTATAEAPTETATDAADETGEGPATSEG